MIRGLYWFSQNVSTSSSFLLLVLLGLKVRSRGYKQSREGHVPSLWWCGVMNSECPLCDVICDGSFVRCPLVGCPAIPFIGQGKARVTTREKRRTRGREKSFRVVGPFLSSVRAPLTWPVVIGSAPRWAPVRLMMPCPKVVSRS